MSNPTFNQMGFGGDEFDNFGFGLQDLGVDGADNYPRMDGANHLLGMANDNERMIDNVQHPIVGLTRGRSQTFHLNNQITTTRNPLFTAGNEIGEGDPL